MYPSVGRTPPLSRDSPQVLELTVGLGLKADRHRHHRHTSLAPRIYRRPDPPQQSNRGGHWSQMPSSYQLFVTQKSSGQSRIPPLDPMPPRWPLRLQNGSLQCIVDGMQWEECIHSATVIGISSYNPDDEIRTSSRVGVGFFTCCMRPNCACSRLAGFGWRRGPWRSRGGEQRHKGKSRIDVRRSEGHHRILSRPLVRLLQKAARWAAREDRIGSAKRSEGRRRECGFTGQGQGVRRATWTELSYLF